jgi:hypothetical protein
VPETFVDVTSRGLEVGRQLRLCDVGPGGAYLEHPLPMPVGARLRIDAGDGVAIAAVVVRVQEQVAGAERPPGMFVKVIEMVGAAEAWWNERVTRDDDPLGGPVRNRVDEPAPDADDRSELEPRDSVAMSPGELSSLAADAGRQPGDVASTLKMTADQIKSITDTAPEAAVNGDSDGRPRGKKNRRRKNRRTGSPRER